MVTVDTKDLENLIIEEAIFYINNIAQEAAGAQKISRDNGLVFWVIWADDKADICLSQPQCVLAVATKVNGQWQVTEQWTESKSGAS